MNNRQKKNNGGQRNQLGSATLSMRGGFVCSSVKCSNKWRTMNLIGSSLSSSMNLSRLISALAMRNRS